VSADSWWRSTTRVWPQCVPDRRSGEPAAARHQAMTVACRAGCTRSWSAL
jgi:hypothetical protein